MAYRHIFGPVLSRRLGLSLGIDLVPYKTCPYDCVYCECGHTTTKILERQDFFPASEVIDELGRVLASSPRLDTITFAGSGEPTLSRALGPVITWLKQEYPEYTVSVLTSGSLLTDSTVREELLPADRVIPTLTTVSRQTFERIHRPHPSLTVDDLIRGMEEFRAQYKGSLWLEVFIIPGLNTTDRELAGIRGAIGRIRPDRIQLNTLDRPPAEGWVEAATDTEMERIRRVLGSSGDVDIALQQPPLTPAMREAVGPADLIRATLSRRPSTLGDLVRTTGLDREEVETALGMLERTGEVGRKRMARGIFYAIRQKKGDNKDS